MEGVYEELDEANAEINKLREECRRKAELSESLKKSYNEQLIKAREASSKIEKQAQEINEKAEEISVFKQTSEDLRRCLNEKESIIKHLSTANEKYRLDCDEKFKKWEGENQQLVLALEEVNRKNFDQEQRIRAYKEEIEGLKGSLSVLQKKCLEAEKRANGTEEARETQDVLLGLEEEKKKIEDQLKWKKEQFTHLEEAHLKMRNHFKASEKEWELEKCSLLDEICSLQTSLDSQTRISEDLQNHLQICNQVLAREESKRKSLEVQLSDVQGRFENVYNDYEDAKFQLMSLTEKRDEEIASLRHLLSKKETVLKEMAYQKKQIEQENEDLVKELQECKIQKASGSPFAPKPRNKLKSSEQMHKESIANLKAKEAELNSQLEKMTQELNNYGSQLESKNEMINDLRMELKQMHEYNTNLNAKEDERNSEFKRVKNDLINCQSEVESRDGIIEELRLALEQIHADSTANFQAQEVEWKSQLETMIRDLKSCQSQLQGKDEIIANLKKELEQMHEEYSGKLKAKEAEQNSQLEKVTNDLNNLRSLLESRDATIRELRMELEQIHGESAAQLQAREAEWKYQVQMMTEDIQNYRSQLERKDQTIKELKMELEQQHEDYCANICAKEAEGISQLEKVANELINYRSELNSRDEMIRALRSQLGEVRGDFVANLKSKEAEWKCQLEMMTGDLNRCRSKLDDKDARVKELGTDLEDCHSLCLQLKLQNEEISTMLLVLEDGISEAQLKIANEKAEMDRSIKVKEENISLLRQQLEMKNADIDRLHSDFGKERENAASLLRRVEFLDIDGRQQQLLMQKDLDTYEEMLMESSIRELFLREQILQNEGVLRKKLKEVCHKLEKANSELAEKTCEGNGMEFELYIWKSVAERFKVVLEEGLEMRKELEASLLAQAVVGETIEQEKERLIRVLEEKDGQIDNLQQQIVLLEQNLQTREAGAFSLELENLSYLGILGEKDANLEQLQREVGWLEQESLRKELEEFLFAKIGVERIDQDNKEQVNDLMQLVESLEDKFKSSLISFSSQLAEKQAEINQVHEAWEKIAAAETMAALEIEEKKLLIVELEDDVRNVRQKLELQQKSMCDLKQQASEVEAKLEAKEFEMKKLSDELKTRLRNSDALIEELKSERRKLIEDVTELLLDRENMLGFFGQLEDRIDELSSRDTNLTDMLESMMISCDNHGLRMDLSITAKENVGSPTAVKKFEASSDMRSPFREINN